jgi:putative ABC transport system substrate-binding protein
MSRRRALRALTCGLAGLAAGALVTRLAGAAEPTQKVVRVGFVSLFSPSTSPRYEAVFWERLRELGWIEGQNLVVEARWTEGRYDRLSTLMAEVVGLKVDVLVTYSTPAVIAAKNATNTIPIVAEMGDPVGSGLAASLAHPGGNVTGLSAGWAEGMAGKWLELLQDTVPRLSTVAVIFNPDSALNQDQVKKLEAVAATRAIKIRLIAVRGPEALDRVFEQVGRKAQAVLVLPDNPNLFAHRAQVTALAAKHRIPTIYFLRDFVDAGGLMAYAPDFAVVFRRTADYVDKILKGEKPGDLPIEQPTKFELVVNLKTAKALGITIPESILLRADEVIR